MEYKESLLVPLVNCVFHGTQGNASQLLIPCSLRSTLESSLDEMLNHIEEVNSKAGLSESVSSLLRKLPSALSVDDFELTTVKYFGGTRDLLAYCSSFLLIPPESQPKFVYIVAPERVPISAVPLSSVICLLSGASSKPSVHVISLETRCFSEVLRRCATPLLM